MFSMKTSSKDAGSIQQRCNKINRRLAPRSRPRRGENLERDGRRVPHHGRRSDQMAALGPGWRRAAGMSSYNDALYTNSTLALNPRTGQVAWYFQHVPGETLDLDIVFERVLVDRR